MPVVNLEINNESEILQKKISLRCKIEANPIERLDWFKNGIYYNIKMHNFKEINKVHKNSQSIIYFSSHKNGMFNEDELFKFQFILTLLVK